jgi:mRNA interferase RelE/StbE
VSPPPAYRLVVTHSAGRSLAEDLPEAVAAAALEFLTGDLLLAPHRVGKPLQRELTGTWSARRGGYRILYEIDDQEGTVRVVHVAHRGLAYRRR